MTQSAMYEAMRDKKVDAISAYTTDSRNGLYGIKLLNDDKHAFPPYDAVILVSRDFAQKNPKAMEALGKLNNSINDDTMSRLNGEHDINGLSPNRTYPESGAFDLAVTLVCLLLRQWERGGSLITRLLSLG